MFDRLMICEVMRSPRPEVA